MKIALLSLVLISLLASCTPREPVRSLQTFTPAMVDMGKIDEKDYSELIAAVNTQYAPQTKEFNDARLFKEEGMFLYFHIYSGASTLCYRVTVDRNRSKLINAQPDCAIEDE